jgi:hypothetical protein
MDRLREWQQRNQAWVQQHPWKYSILVGVWFTIVMGITGYVVNNDSLLPSAVVALITDIFFTLGWRFLFWPMMRRHPPSSRCRAWETAFSVGVLAWLATWNFIVFVFGFDTSFAIATGSSIAVGIVVTLLAHQWIVMRKLPWETCGSKRSHCLRNHRPRGQRHRRTHRQQPAVCLLGDIILVIVLRIERC